MHAHEPQAIVTEHEKARKQAGLGALLAGIAALTFALATLLLVLWLMLAGTTATPFDSDGVRCYGKALQISCLKTAEPPR